MKIDFLCCGPSGTSIMARSAHDAASQLPRPSKISTNQLEYLKKNALPDLLKHASSWPFLKPVDFVALSLPDYPNIVRKPINLEAIKTRLNIKYYYNAAECINDVHLIFLNCFIFNPPGDDIVSMGVVLWDLFQSKLKKLPYPETEIAAPGRKGVKKNRPNVVLPSSEACSTATEVTQIFPKLSNFDPPIHTNFITPVCSTTAPSVCSIKGDDSIFRDQAELRLNLTPLQQETLDEIYRPDKKSKRESKKKAKKKKIKSSKPLKSCRRILKVLMSKKHRTLNTIFLEPVDVVGLKLFDYNVVVKNPIDLGTIKKKLKSGEYIDKSEFASDIRLMFSNCTLYNQEGSDIDKIGKNLQAVFEKLYKKLPDNVSLKNIVDDKPVSPVQKLSALDSATAVSPVEPFTEILLESMSESLQQEENEPVQAFIGQSADLQKIENMQSKVLDDLRKITSVIKQVANCYDIPTENLPTNTVVDSTDITRQLHSDQVLVDTNQPLQINTSSDLFSSDTSELISKAAALLTGSSQYPLSVSQLQPVYASHAPDITDSNLNSGKRKLPVARTTVPSPKVRRFNQGEKSRPSRKASAEAVLKLEAQSNSGGYQNSSIASSRASRNLTAAQQLAPKPLAVPPEPSPQKPSQIQTPLKSLLSPLPPVLKPIPADNSVSSIQATVVTTPVKSSRPVVSSTLTTTNTVNNYSNDKLMTNILTEVTPSSAEQGFTYEEIHKLNQSINDLPEEKIPQIIVILKKNEPSMRNANPEKIEIDYQALKPCTLREIEKYVKLVSFSHNMLDNESNTPAVQKSVLKAPSASSVDSNSSSDSSDSNSSHSEDESVKNTRMPLDNHKSSTCTQENFTTSEAPSLSYEKASSYISAVKSEPVNDRNDTPVPRSKSKTPEKLKQLNDLAHHDVHIKSNHLSPALSTSSKEKAHAPVVTSNNNTTTPTVAGDCRRALKLSTNLATMKDKRKLDSDSSDMESDSETTPSPEKTKKPLWGSQLFSQTSSKPTSLKRVDSEAEKQEKKAAARLIQNETKRVSQLSQKEEASRLAREKAEREQRVRQAERAKQESKQREEDARQAEIEKRQALERRKAEEKRTRDLEIIVVEEPINVHELLCDFENHIDTKLFEKFKFDL